MMTSERDGEMGCLDYDGVCVDVPNALARLSTNLDARNCDSTGLGLGLDVVDETRIMMIRDFGERRGYYPRNRNWKGSCTTCATPIIGCIPMLACKSLLSN